MLNKQKASLVSKFIALGIAGMFIMSFLGGFAYLMRPSKQAQNPINAEEANFQNQVSQTQTYLQENPDDIQAWTVLGNLYYDQGVQAGDLNMFTAAANAYKKVLELDPKQNDVRTDMALAYLFMDNTEKAIAELKKVLENDPNHVNAILNLGYVNKIAGNISETIKYWEKFLEVAPQDHPKISDVEKGLEEIKKEILEIQEDTTELGSGL